MGSKVGGRNLWHGLKWLKTSQNFDEQKNRVLKKASILMRLQGFQHHLLVVDLKIHGKLKVWHVQFYLYDFEVNLCLKFSYGVVLVVVDGERGIRVFIGFQGHFIIFFNPMEYLLRFIQAFGSLRNKNSGLIQTLIKILITKFS